MKRILALVALLLLILLVVRHTQAQNFAGQAGQIYSNVTVNVTNAASPQLLIGKLPDGVIDGCTRFSVLTNGTTATPLIIYGTNSVTAGGDQVTPGNGVAYCNAPHWQGPFYAYLATPGTAVISISFTPLTNSP